MSLTKRDQPISNNTQQSVVKSKQNITNLNLNKKQIQKSQPSQQASTEIKDVSYVDVYRNRKIHFIYLTLIVSIGVIGFTYLKNQHSTEVIYRDVTRDVSSISGSKPLQNHYNSKYYEEEAIRMRVRNEIEILVANEYERFSLESETSRNLDRSRGVFRLNHPEINLKHEKNRIRIRAEGDRRLCELLQDKVHCARWENYKKVSDQL